MPDLGDVGAIQDALESQLETLDGLNAHNMMPGSIVTPAGMVQLVGIEYADSFDGVSQYHFTVVLAVRAINLDARRANLNEYMNPRGERSIQQVLEADPTLGGISQYVVVQRVHDVGVIDIGGSSYWGGVFDVDVTAV